jgi:hypothetical protein
MAQAKVETIPALKILLVAAQQDRSDKEGMVIHWCGELVEEVDITEGAVAVLVLGMSAVVVEDQVISEAALPRKATL